MESTLDLNQIKTGTILPSHTIGVLTNTKVGDSNFLRVADSLGSEIVKMRPDLHSHELIEFQDKPAIIFTDVGLPISFKRAGY